MTKIKDLGKYDRPREKLFKYGIDKLENDELLALVLGSGIKGVNVKVLAKRILKLYQLNPALTLDDLKEVKGLGPAKAAQVLAVLTLSKRLHEQIVRAKIKSAEDVWVQCASFRDSKREHFAALLLDTQLQLIKLEIISIGTLNASLVHPREVFEPAIKHSAHSVILVHNHPSGDLTPSKQDIEITDRLVEAGKLLGIEVRDHIIISSKEWWSCIHK